MRPSYYPLMKEVDQSALHCQGKRFVRLGAEVQDRQSMPPRTSYRALPPRPGCGGGRRVEADGATWRAGYWHGGHHAAVRLEAEGPSRHSHRRLSVVGCRSLRGLQTAYLTRFNPYQEAYRRLLRHRDEILDVLRDAGKEAQSVAQETMEDVRMACGVIRTR